MKQAGKKVVCYVYVRKEKSGAGDDFYNGRFFCCVEEKCY